MAVANRQGALVLLELNELCPALVRRFVDAGELPHFRRFLAESRAYITDAGESPPHLEPWIQWVTVHSGLPFREHRVFYLGDGPKLSAPCVWDAVSAAGRPVWICGSMNIRHDPSLRGAVLPDPWTDTVPARPRTLAPFHRFVQRHVLEHAGGRAALGAAEHARFAAFMASHGLRPATVRAAVEQLLDERGGRYRWRRAALLDKLQFDVFRWYFRRARPAFSTFFLNSTAHFQHMYWRNMEPEAFPRRPAEPEPPELGGAILFGHRQMDALLARFLELSGDDVTLVLATALSQQPCLAYEAEGGKVLHRACSVRGLLDFAGVCGEPRISPVMSVDFHLEFGDEAEAADAARRLEAVHLVGGRDIMNVERAGRVVVAGATTRAVPEDALVASRVTGRSMLFTDMFYRAPGLKSGMHHPDGLLWIRGPSRDHVAHDGKVPLTSIAPTLLAMLGVPRPPTMRGPLLQDALG